MEIEFEPNFKACPGPAIVLRGPGARALATAAAGFASGEVSC